MFTLLDRLLYPIDDCEIYEYNKNKYVYAIYKNGRSSLRQSGFKKLTLEEIQSITSLDVYIRDPFERYISGVQTYLSHLPDRKTVLKFIDDILFLNRHFSLQMFWIMNLIRFVPLTTKINIKHINECYDITNERRNKSKPDQTLIDYFSGNLKLQFYLLADNVLYKDLMNTSVNLIDIFSKFKEKYPEVYQQIIGNSKQISDVLP